MVTKVKSLLLISPILILFVSSSSKAIIPPSGPLLLFDNRYYGAFDGSEGEQTFVVSYTYNGNKDVEKVYEILEGRCNGERVTLSYTDYHSVTKGGLYTANLTFYPNAFNEYNTIDMFFAVISDKTASYLYSNSFILNKKTPMTIKPYIDDEVIYTSKKTIFSLTDSDQHSETFDFGFTADVFPNKNYYSLDISNFRIAYSSLTRFSYKTAYLIYYDTKNIFPRLAKGAQGAVSFPLKIIEGKTHELLFSFNNSYYVNPHTLEISKLKKKGDVSADRIYLPIGRKDDIEGDRFYIKIEGAGANDSLIECELTYYSSNNLFGYCDDSDYCIKGGNI